MARTRRRQSLRGLEHERLGHLRKRGASQVRTATTTLATCLGDPVPFGCGADGPGQRAKEKLPLVCKKPRQEISQAVSRQNHPPISNAPGTDHVARRKHRSRCNHRAIHTPTPRAANPPAVAISNLRRNLEASLLPTTQSWCSQAQSADSAETPGRFGAPLSRFVAVSNSSLMMVYTQRSVR